MRLIDLYWFLSHKIITLLPEFLQVLSSSHDLLLLLVDFLLSSLLGLLELLLGLLLLGFELLSLGGDLFQQAVLVELQALGLLGQVVGPGPGFLGLAQHLFALADGVLGGALGALDLLLDGLAPELQGLVLV